MSQRKEPGQWAVNAILFGTLTIAIVVVFQAVRTNYSPEGFQETPIPSPPPEATDLLPAETSITPDPYPGSGTALPPGTAPPLSTPLPTWDHTNPPTLPPATPKPITYSITSTEDWMTYTNPELGLILKYPETEPRVYHDSIGDEAWDVLNLSIRTGPTVPADYSNRAVIIIAIHPNVGNLPLSDAIKLIKANYGNLYLTNQPPVSETLLTHLLDAGAEEVGAFTSDDVGLLIYGAKYRGKIYLIAGAIMTAGEAQSQILSIVLPTLRFI